MDSEVLRRMEVSDTVVNKDAFVRTALQTLECGRENADLWFALMTGTRILN